MPIRARGGLTSGFMDSLSCEARALRSPRDPTPSNTIGTAETKERADTKDHRRIRDRVRAVDRTDDHGIKRTSHGKRHA